MSDIRKILDRIDETTAGAVATVAQPLFKQQRVKENKPSDWADWGREGTDNGEIKNKFRGLKKVREGKNAVTEADLSEQDLLALKFKPTDVVTAKKHDHEVPMALDDLQAIIKRASEMLEIISAMPRSAQIPGWVQTKIGRANDSLVDAADHIIGTAQRGERMLESNQEYNQIAAELNQARKNRDQQKVKDLSDKLAALAGPRGFETDIYGNAKLKEQLKTSKNKGKKC